MQDNAEPIPEEFFDRADEIIRLANVQLSNEIRSKVSASTLYAAARFNAFVSATSYANGEQMAKDVTEISDYFVEQYRKMLNEHLEDYVANFADIVGARSDE